MVTYCKLKSGNWGIRSDSDLADGTTTVVTKRDGTQKKERVGKKVWSKPADKVFLFEIKQAKTARATACDNCGRFGAIHECQDSSGLTGVCCSACARMGRFERSFG